MQSNVITFPTTPPFQEPRKRGARSTAQKVGHIASNLPALIDDVKLDMAIAWDRGVKLAWLAKMNNLTIDQAEAVVWEARSLWHRPGPLGRPSVLARQQIHVASGRAA